MDSAINKIGKKRRYVKWSYNKWDYDKWCYNKWSPVKRIRLNGNKRSLPLTVSCQVRKLNYHPRDFTPYAM